MHFNNKLLCFTNAHFHEIHQFSLQHFKLSSRTFVQLHQTGNPLDYFK